MEEKPYQIDQTLDLRGKQCPMTFVYTKVALEKLQAGQILKIILDFRSAFKNVPKSIITQKLGIILSKREENGICELIVERA